MDNFFTLRTVYYSTPLRENINLMLYTQTHPLTTGATAGGFFMDSRLVNVFICSPNSERLIGVLNSDAGLYVFVRLSNAGAQITFKSGLD